MMNKILALTVTLTLALIQPASAALIEIGAAGGVRGRVQAFAPGAEAAGRIMSSGKVVYHKDKITTGPEGMLQVLLRDETVFTIGQDAEMTLDEFVYDPFTQTGKVEATISKGVFRFVTGKIARKKPSAMKVKLPTGTIGIRGTIAAGDVSGFPMLVALVGPGANNNANERPGQITVTSGGVTQTVTRPGYGVIIESPGAPPSKPFQLKDKDYARLKTEAEAKKKKEEKKTAAAPQPKDQDQKDGDQTGENPPPSTDQPADGDSATADAGEDTAGAAGDLVKVEGTGAIITTLDDVQNTGAEEINEGGGSTWDDLRNTSITGTGYWDTGGGYQPASCTGAGCGSTNEFTMYLYADFAAKSFTSGGVYVRGDSGSAYMTGGSLSGPIAFPSGGDPAVFDWVAHGGQAGTFNGSNVTFQNANGQFGDSADLNVHYNNGSNIEVSGSYTSPWVPN